MYLVEHGKGCWVRGGRVVLEGVDNCKYEVVALGVQCRGKEYHYVHVKFVDEGLQELLVLA